jgi:hypothetical protein
MQNVESSQSSVAFKTARSIGVFCFSIGAAIDSFIVYMHFNPLGPSFSFPIELVGRLFLIPLFFAVSLALSVAIVVHISNNRAALWITYIFMVFSIAGYFYLMYSGHFAGLMPGF